MLYNCKVSKNIPHSKVIVRLSQIQVSSYLNTTMEEIISSYLPSNLNHLQDKNRLAMLGLVPNTRLAEVYIFPDTSFR